MKKEILNSKFALYLLYFSPFSYNLIYNKIKKYTSIICELYIRIISPEEKKELIDSLNKIKILDYYKMIYLQI